MYTVKYIKNWEKDIEQSKEGFTKIDLSEDTENILIDNAFLNVVGEEIGSTPFELEYVGDKIETRKTTFGKAVFQNFAMLGT